MLSITQIAITILVILVVLQGGRMLGEWRKAQDRQRARDAEERAEAAAARVRDEQETAIEDLTKCPACGNFVPETGARDCGRAGCPNAGLGSGAP